MGWIYKITNKVNGKIYIGKTEHSDPYKRWKEHLHDYNKRKNEKRPLYSAIKKYGEDAFIFETIEKTDNAEEREIYWINKLRTYIGFKDCNGYNATLGGDGKKYLNLDEKEVISYHLSDAVYMVSNTAKHFGVDTETIKKILYKNDIGYMPKDMIYEYKNILLENGNKGIVKVDPNTLAIIDYYVNADDAVLLNETFKTTRKTIQNSCNTYKKLHGFLWFTFKYYIDHDFHSIAEENVDKLISQYYEDN